MNQYKSKDCSHMIKISKSDYKEADQNSQPKSQQQRQKAAYNEEPNTPTNGSAKERDQCRKHVDSTTRAGEQELSS